MNISEKLQTIADNQPIIYDAGYKSGQQSMIDESKIIEKTVTGTNQVYATDISEIPHEYKIKLSSDTITDFSNISISKYGVNLFTFKNRTVGDFGESSNTTLRKFEEDKYYFRVSANNHYGSRNTFEILDNNSVRMTTINAYGLGVPFKVLPNCTYSISCDKSDNIACTINIGLYDANGTYLDTIYGATSWTVPENCEWMLICFVGVGASSEALEIEFRNIQLEIGSVSTKFEQYTEPQTVKANVDGTVEGITSTSPKTLLIASNNNIDIALTYHKSFGTQLEYDRFWDNYQDYGYRTDYSYAFAGKGWTDKTFNPKYTIKVKMCTGTFTNGANIQSKVIEADFSDATSMTNTFNGANVKHIGVLNCPNVSNFNLTWLACSAEQIDLIKLNKNGGQKFTSSFDRMANLKEIRFEGLISENVGFSNSTLLDKESLINIFSVLSTDSTGKTLSISLSAVNTAFETAEGLADGSTSEEWLALRATKENWTITLV